MTRTELGWPSGQPVAGTECEISAGTEGGAHAGLGDVWRLPREVPGVSLPDSPPEGRFEGLKAEHLVSNDPTYRLRFYLHLLPGPLLTSCQREVPLPSCSPHRAGGLEGFHRAG